MTSGTILLLILSLAVAAGLSYFQYFHKSTGKIRIWLSLLRFTTIFGLLLLLINPVISNTSYETEKSPLVLAIDDSRSVRELKAAELARATADKILSDRRLRDKFSVQPILFSEDVVPGDTLSFEGSQTNIDKLGSYIRSVHKNKIHPVILLSDGNQTRGADYPYSFQSSSQVFPIVLGDTTEFFDLKVSRLNVNKYAFLKNRFPVEIFMQFSGKQAARGALTITSGNQTLHRETITFSATDRTQTVNVLLPASKVGIQNFKVALSGTQPERNLINNVRNFAVEVIDQKTEVAIVSEINHPDLAAIKRAISGNAQRQVKILKPGAVTDVNLFNVLIFYQPDGSFRKLWESANQAGVNIWTITGLHTDFDLLNAVQADVAFRMSGQQENYLPVFSESFGFFAVDDIGFASLPPLENPYGVITVRNGATLLDASIRNIKASQPLLTFSEQGSKRSAYLFGEHLWKWRMQSHVDHKSFEKFDVFIDKIIQFLATNNSRKSLIVEASSFYNSGEEIEITAQYFNKNFELDENARLSLSVTNLSSRSVKNYDMLRGGNNYKANLDGLPSGRYKYTVKETRSGTTQNGTFEIIDYDIEKQFVNPDLAKLRQTASITAGTVYMPDKVESLIQQLMADDRYKPVEKSIVRRIPLIEWWWLLLIIAASLATEWLIRKYHGML